ncbi:LysR family transcriptional regulator [Bacillus sp. V3B]|uniref:LysR family transcriptional regulator n=1 Tax=Bacillus sp. V3B TaxID=2804915 RepID=UPI00210E6115|nr:LysR family transcriptional regulator [Bacillus sp. V3B]MCQ6276314.1 LysR family transcriptional regulator [Bacillus sp. V3B]
MDTIQLETFFTVIKHKNYTKAAEILHVSQPTVSSRIKNLENELDCILFEKDGKNLVLSKEGITFEEYASSILANMIHSKEATRSSKYQKLKIGFSPGFSYSFITEVITSILSIDNLEVSIFEGKDSMRLTEQIESGELDLVFTRNFVSHKPNIISEHLFDDQLVLICGENHRLADCETITPNDLQGETLICYQRHTPLWTEVEQQLTGIRDIKRIEMGNNEMVKSVVESGIGVGITASLGIDNLKVNNLLVKNIEKINKIPNKIFVQYKENTLIEQHIKRIIYSIINHEIKK